VIIIISVKAFKLIARSLPRRQCVQELLSSIVGHQLMKESVFRQNYINSKQLITSFWTFQVKLGARASANKVS